MPYQVAPDIFFLIEGERVLLWNCATHEQFLLDRKYFEQLFALNENTIKDQSIFDALLQSKVIAINTSKASSWGWDILSKLFHVGTRDVPSIEFTEDPTLYTETYLKECNAIRQDTPNFFQEKNTPIIDLPTPSLNFDESNFGTILKNRKTSRHFNGEPISLQELSNFLYASFGLIHGEWETLSHNGLQIIGLRKSSPSSGAIHAEEAYLTIFNVTELAQGLYYYRPQDHKLNLLRTGNFEKEVISLNKNQFFSAGLAFGIYISGRLDKYWWKYKHSRTYRIMLIDLGHISQTCLLTATALRWNTWLTGAFHDSKVESFLEIDGSKESVFLYIGFGHGNGRTFPENF